MEVNREAIQSKICDLMEEGFEVPRDKLVPEAKLYEDLSLDSLDAVDMLVHLEENLGIKVDGERFTHVRSLQDVFDVVWAVVNEAKSEQQASPLIVGADQPELG